MLGLEFQYKLSVVQLHRIPGNIMLKEWFGLDNVTSLLIIGVILFVILAGIFFIQMRRTQKSLMGRVLNIQGNIRSNIRVCNRFQKKGVIKRLKTEAWEKHHENVDFLPEDLREELAALFRAVGEVNQQIDVDVSQRLDNQADYVDVSKILEPQNDCFRRLDKWVFVNINNPNYMPRRKGWFRF